REEHAMRDRTAQLLSPPYDFHDIETLIRGRIGEVIGAVLEEELETALGAGRHERTPGRRGYRHASRPARRLMTSFGAIEVEVPRGRLKAEGGTREYESELVPRYQRRSRRLDAVVLTSYLVGVNTRKVRLALRPLVEGTALSRSAVSRLVKRLRGLMEGWRSRDLSGETYLILILDAFRVPVRLARRVVRVPVQTVVGVKEGGERELLELRLSPSESTRSWQGVVEGLVRRNLAAPILVMLDGNAGLIRAVRESWPTARIQRCTRHKLENLLGKAPKHCHGELKRDYDAIVYAQDGREADEAYTMFCRKWEKLVPEVVVSLEEGGSELLTFYDFPSEMWKSLRTTNMIERVNEEFRRRIKTQGSFPTEASALILLYGLVACGAIRLRKIDGYRRLADVVAGAREKSA
ncbi:MAG: IS256 family transposase, partial [Candidatus Eisenbacteria bacterium]